MIIDGHIHLFSTDVINNREFYCQDNSFSMLYEDSTSKIADASMLSNYIEETGIQKCFALSHQWINREFSKLQNEYIMSISMKNRGIIIPFGNVALESVDPYKDALKLSEIGFIGIGEVAFYENGFGLKEEEFLIEILKACSFSGMRLILHLNEPVGHNYKGKYTTDFSRLLSIISQFTDVRIMFSHLGGGIFTYELMKEIKTVMRNIFYDTAALPYIYDDKIYNAAIDCVGPDKIVFGSDFPLLRLERYADTIKKMVPEYSDKILYSNALRFLDKKTEEASSE